MARMNTSVPIQKIKLLNPYSREFDLDETVAKARQKARAKHFQTFTVPAHRLVGLLLLCCLVYLHNLYVLETLTPDGLRDLGEFLLGYGILTWVVLKLVFERWPGTANCFLFLDLPVWSVAIYCTGAGQSWLFPILLNRVADQTNTTYRRVLAFLHVAAVCYLVVLALSQATVDWSAGLTKLAVLYLSGLYVSFTARTAERLRKRTTRAIDVARHLILQLDEEKATTQQAVEAKERFLRLISHELRTPLNAILGFSAVLEDETFGPVNPKQKRYVQSIHHGGKRLLSLVDDVLVYADADSGKLILQIEHVDFYSLLNHTLQQQEVLLEEKKLDIQSQVTGSGRLWADPEKLTSAMAILVELLALLSEPNAQIEMTFSESASSAKISISVGSLKLEREELAELQNPFERSSMYEGLGLEVPLVRHIVRAHGGFLEVDLRPDGSGVSFSMVFPHKI